MSIRPMRPEDAGVVAALASQLGYPSTEEQVALRSARIGALSDEAIFVFENGGRVVGWIHLFTHYSLCTEPRVEVAGLVVDESARGHGVGARLMAHAEAWTRERGCAQVRLSSNIIREDAHRFYRRLGYDSRKTSRIFTKDL